MFGWGHNVALKCSFRFSKVPIVDKQVNEVPLLAGTCRLVLDGQEWTDDILADIWPNDALWELVIAKAVDSHQELSRVCVAAHSTGVKYIVYSLERLLSSKCTPYLCAFSDASCCFVASRPCLRSNRVESLQYRYLWLQDLWPISLLLPDGVE